MEKEDNDIIPGKEIYNALQDYLAQRPTLNWAQTELAGAANLGIRDSKNPMQLVPCYQAAITAKQAAPRVVRE